MLRGVRNLLGWLDCEVGARHDFFSKENIDGNFATGLLVRRISTAKVPEPALILSGESFQDQALAGENQFPVTIIGGLSGQPESGGYRQVRTLRTGLGAIVSGNDPSLVFSSCCPHEIPVFGFDKLPP